jgi:hypothetical protein
MIMGTLLVVLTQNVRKEQEVRSVSSGKISSNQMKIAIRLSMLGSIFLTVLTSYFGSFGFNEPIQIFLFFSFVGLSCNLGC